MGRDVDFDHRARRGLSRSFQLSVNMPLGMWGVPYVDTFIYMYVYVLYMLNTGIALM